MQFERGTLPLQEEEKSLIVQRCNDLLISLELPGRQEVIL
jgi:hypothetical protein